MTTVSIHAGVPVQSHPPQPTELGAAVAQQLVDEQIQRDLRVQVHSPFLTTGAGLEFTERGTSDVR
jgi:hypothetical protein